ncbi:hypothetical protein [Azospirillum argentinense]
MDGADRCLPHNFAGGGPAWILYGGIGGADASAGCPRAGSEPRLPAAPFSPHGKVSLEMPTSAWTVSQARKKREPSRASLAEQ